MTVINLLLSAATLGVLLWYTLLTRSIAKSAQDQVEASQRPVLTISATRRLRDGVVDFIEQRESGVPVGQQVAHVLQYQVAMKNVGAGPAFGIVYKIYPAGEQPDATGEYVYLRSLAYLEPGEEIMTPLIQSLACNKDFEFVAGYESLSKRRYRTRIVLKKLVFDSCEIREL